MLSASNIFNQVSVQGNNTQSPTTGKDHLANPGLSTGLTKIYKVAQQVSKNKTLANYKNKP